MVLRHDASVVSGAFVVYVSASLGQNQCITQDIAAEGHDALVLFVTLSYLAYRTSVELLWSLLLGFSSSSLFYFHLFLFLAH